MSRSFTPGLKVHERTRLFKRRVLPIQGQVLAKVGDAVKPDDVVARTELPGDVFPVNVANQLGLSAADVLGALTVPVGGKVIKDADMAITKSFFGLFTNEVKAPITGTVESVNPITGMVLVRGAPHEVKVSAYLSGRVSEIHEREGVTVETIGSFIQGIFGIGGETVGPIAMGVEKPDDVLDEDCILPRHAGAVVVGGRMVTAAAVRKAIATGVKAIVTGGIDDQDLRGFLGYDIGVAITGQETLGITLVVTEGFGAIRMAEHTFGLLAKRVGKMASVNGATQIRAGVIRPEVVIPLDIPEVEATPHMAEPAETRVGDLLRCIRYPYFGRIGQVKSVPEQLTRMPSGTWVRVFEIAFDDGSTVIVPRANVERIEQQGSAVVE